MFSNQPVSSINLICFKSVLSLILIPNFISQLFSGLKQAKTNIVSIEQFLQIKESLPVYLCIRFLHVFCGGVSFVKLCITKDADLKK